MTRRGLRDGDVGISEAEIANPWWFPDAVKANSPPVPQAEMLRILPECGCASKMDGCSLTTVLGNAGFLSTVSLNPSDATLVETASPRLLLSVDGGTPVLPEPELAGRVAFNHAASDIFASAGRVLYATIFVSVPSDMSQSSLAGFLRGIRECAADHDAVIVNGHTAVSDGAVLQYSISVVGHPIATRSLNKHGAQIGDRLFLSKPIAGAITLRAMVLGMLNEVQVSELHFALLTSNFAASSAMIAAGANAATDVTGFGLVGSLAEMLPSLGARIDTAAIPFLPGARSLATNLGSTAATSANARYAGQRHRLVTKDLQVRTLTCDPATSGPLLVSAPMASTEALVSCGFRAIGEVVEERSIILD